jgi:hypothetical protein
MLKQWLSHANKTIARYFFRSRKESYQTAGDKLEEQAGNRGTKALSDPVEDSGENGDVAANGQTEGDGWVEVATGDVSSHRDSNEECKCMGYGHGNEPSGVQGRICC